MQGQTDVDLDDEGRAQAGRVAVEMAKLGPTVLWSSDLRRARQTAAAVSEATGVEVVHDARLREFGLGEREGLTHDEYAAPTQRSSSGSDAATTTRHPGPSRPSTCVRG